MAEHNKSKIFKKSSIVPNPLQGFEESLKALQIPNPLQGFEESLKALQIPNPLQGFEESLKALHLGPIQEFQESMKALHLDSLQEFQESMKAIYLGPIQEFQESMKAMHLDSLQEFQESILALQPPKSFNNLLSSISSDRWPLVPSDYTNLKISSNGTISIGTDLITQDDLELKINELVIHATSDKNLILEEGISKLSKEVSKLKEPILQKIITILILELVIKLFLHFVEPYIDINKYKPINKEQKRLIINTTKTVVSNNIVNKAHLNYYRIVTASKLNVRMSNSIDSAIIGKLYTGNVIIILEKKRNWTLIRWTDEENNTSIQGWVFSRYLKKIK